MTAGARGETITSSPGQVGLSGEMKTAFERFETAHLLALAGDNQLADSMLEIVARHPETPHQAVPFIRGLQAFLRRDRLEIAAQRNKATRALAEILDVLFRSSGETYCEAYQRISPRRGSDELAFLAFSMTDEGRPWKPRAVTKPMPSLAALAR